jgi:hemerythrin
VFKKTITKTMENITNEGKMTHKYLLRLNDELTNKLVQHARENDMKISMVIRRSLRQFFQNEELKKIVKPVKK